MWWINGVDIIFLVIAVAIISISLAFIVVFLEFSSALAARKCLLDLLVIYSRILYTCTTICIVTVSRTAVSITIFATSSILPAWRTSNLLLNAIQHSLALNLFHYLLLVNRFYQNLLLACVSWQLTWSRALTPYIITMNTRTVTLRTLIQIKNMFRLTTLIIYLLRSSL